MIELLWSTNPDIEKQQQAQNHIVMSKEDLARILQTEHDSTYYLNDSDLVYKDTDNTIENDPKHTIRSIAYSETWSWSIEAMFHWVPHQLSIVWDSTQRYLALTKDGKTVRLAAWKPKLWWFFWFLYSGARLFWWKQEILEEWVRFEWINAIHINGDTITIDADYQDTIEEDWETINTINNVIVSVPSALFEHMIHHSMFEKKDWTHIYEFDVTKDIKKQAAIVASTVDNDLYIVPEHETDQEKAKRLAAINESVEEINDQLAKIKHFAVTYEILDEQ